jgi:hypothetical protein
MKEIRLIIYLCFASFFSSGQTNLVPNPSFEIQSACPTTLDQTTLATGWSSYGGSTDYYHFCGAAGLGVPSNGIGYQAAATGSAYAGFIAYDINAQTREVLGIQLTQILNIGQVYYISLKVSLAEFDAQNKQYVPCNKIGARFSIGPYTVASPAPVDNIAHVYTNSKISDTLNWTTISGAFICDANYQYLMIGNFFDDSQTDTTYRSNGIRSYFFVDDVCVSTSSATCYESTSIQENKEYQTKIYLDENSVLKIFSDSDYYVDIMDCLGKIVVGPQKNVCRIDVSNLANGVYFTTIVQAKKRITKKLIINH